MELNDKEWERIELVLYILPSGIGSPWRNN